MAAEIGEKNKQFFRKPNSIVWGATLVVIIYAVWCALLLILTVSGHLLNSQNYECGNSTEDLVASSLKNEARLVYLWSGLSVPVCILLLLEFWRRTGFYSKVIPATIFVLFVIMVATFCKLLREEAQGIKEFENQYLGLLPLTDTPGNTQNQPHTICHKRDNVYRWQAEFKCCGLQGYQDWESTIPDSCLCDGEEDSSGCVGAGNILVYEKPCLPTVLSLVKKRSSTFGIVMISWMTIIGIPVTLCVLLAVLICLLSHILCDICDRLSYCIYKMRGGEEMVPVVFIRNNNNNQTEEEKRNDEEAKKGSRDEGVVLDVEGGPSVEGEGREAAEEDWSDNTVRMIPLSELRRLQEELDPPPVKHRVQCLCIEPSKPRNFYAILIEEDSPLLPSGAVLVDADKPTRIYWWVEGPHVFCVKDIVRPRERELEAAHLVL